jgi:DNA-binding FrmR family transcriptional regulator
MNRLRRIEGQIRGVARMVEEEAYYIDILQQILAIQRAVDNLKRELRRTHFEACVTKALQEKNDQSREQVIRELLDILRP